jgi:N-acyl-D-amino-acid deacylase
MPSTRTPKADRDRHGASGQDVDFDLLIRNGTVVDGSGDRRAFVADIGVTNGRIVAIGSIPDAKAAATIDAAGKVVAPGFIDVHLHSEVALRIDGHPHRYGALQQGVTTQLLAPDGFGWAHLDESERAEMWEYTLFSHGPADPGPRCSTAESYLAQFEGRIPANVVPQVPHLPIRLAVMGWDARTATDTEVTAMDSLVREWLDAGAVAFNTGLDYQPAASADTRELVELSRVAAAEGAIYAAHIRYGDLGKEGAWRETFEIAERAGISVHISHEHVDDRTEPFLADADGRIDLTFESYMYPAGCTHLAMMLPTWAQAGGPDAVLARVRDPQTREALVCHLEERLTGEARPRDLVVAANQSGNHIGRSLFDVAAEQGVPIGECAMRMIEEEHPYALMVFHQHVEGAALEERIRRTIQHPAMMVASDGVYHGEFGHPRTNGCFARVLRLCVRKMQAVTLEQAIYKMSGFPATRFQVPNRGFLREGYVADIVVFDPETVADRATWDDPLASPFGVDAVLVDGQVVVDRGTPTGATPGKVLRRQEYGRPL